MISLRLLTIVGLLLSALAAHAADIPTIFVCGDSTAKNTARGAEGWGTAIAQYFDPAKAAVNNVAHAGTSSLTYFEGDWPHVRPQIKEGDYVFLVFGINDGGLGTPGGLDNDLHPRTSRGAPAADAHTYGWYMAKMASDARDKGAHVVLLTVTARDIWTNPKATFKDAAIVTQEDGYNPAEDRVDRANWGRYPEWTKAIGEELQIPVLDLTPLEADRYEKVGREKVMVNYLDHNHTNPAGADLVAQIIVSGLKAFKNSPFTAMLSDAGKALPAADPKYVANNDGPPQYRAFAIPLTGQGLNALPLNPSLPTLWIIGDSTVRNGSGFGGANGQWGWGAPIEYFFDADKINVVNRALGGTSSRTFYNNNWPTVLASVKAGDFVMLQFGHNDKNGDLSGANAGIGSLNGIGDETQQATGRGGNPETVHTFGWYLKQIVEQAKAKGATPIVCSFIPRKIWENGKVIRANANYFPYADWARDVAKAENVAFVDINAITGRKYDELGPDKVEPLFVPMPSEHTHTDWYGAIINAESVISGLKALKDDPLAPYFYGRARDLPAADPAKPALEGTTTLADAANAAKARAAAAAPAASAVQ
ncbi:MAG TPA: GDSL-type esterase/lipase family protein [Opitutales bacterium]|nr:GDSL-type esterase/lipase family protein [Opitutales bacterium]